MKVRPRHLTVARVAKISRRKAGPRRSESLLRLIRLRGITESPTAMSGTTYQSPFPSTWPLAPELTVSIGAVTIRAESHRVHHYPARRKNPPDWVRRYSDTSKTHHDPTWRCDSILPYSEKPDPQHGHPRANNRRYHRPIEYDVPTATDELPYPGTGGEYSACMRRYSPKSEICDAANPT